MILEVKFLLGGFIVLLVFGMINFGAYMTLKLVYAIVQPPSKVQMKQESL